MLHEPLQQQLARLGLRGAADAIARLPCSDKVIDAIAVLLEAECLHRDSLAQSRRIKLAKLGQSAHPADVDLRTPRSLGKTRWQQLISLNWFKQHQHVLLVGPTGIGKSYLACALAKAVIDQKKSVRYLRLPRLGEELATLQAQGRVSHWLKTLARIDLLILDDWGLAVLSQAQRIDLLEILEDRNGRGSTIVTSQVPVDQWHEMIGEPTLADAILDRLVHNAHRFNMTGDSMRKIIGRRALDEDLKPLNP